MTEKKTTSKSTVIAIVLLSLLLIGSIAYILMQNTQIESSKQAFETEKALKIEELKTLQQEYDDFLQENQVNKEEIIETKIRLNRLLDSVRNIKPDYSLVNKLRSVRDNLKLRLKSIEQENKQLKEDNLKLVTENDSVVKQLESTLVVFNEEKEKNEKLNKIVTKAQKLIVTSITSKPIRIKKSGKVSPTNRAKRVSGIEVCYEVPANTITEAGEKEFYIQVVSPTKEVVGGKFYMNDAEGNFVSISKISKFRYQNKIIKVCDYVEPLPGETFAEGNYAVNVFQGTKLISSSSILLK